MGGGPTKVDMPTERAQRRRNRGTRGSAVLLPTLLAAIAACGAGERAGNAPVTTARDSAGIVIVQNGAIPGLDELGRSIARADTRLPSFLTFHPPPYIIQI